MTPLYSKPIDSPLGNILVADNDDKLCLSLKKFFEDSGYGVYVCQSLSDFMEVEHENTRCIILDIDLGGEGLQIIDMVRQSTHEGDVPILLTSSTPSTEKVVKGLGVGADDYIFKPFSTRELMDRVTQLSRNRRRH